MSCTTCNGNCRQGRDCPLRVARVGARIPGPEPLPPETWRAKLGSLALTALCVIAALMFLAMVFTGAFI